MELNLELKEVQLVRQGLGKLPFDEVADLIVKLQNQIAEQLKNKEVKENGNK